MKTTNEQRAVALDERINKLENEFGQGADIGRRELIAGLKADRAALRPSKLTEYDLRLIAQVPGRPLGWVLRGGRLYRPYHGKRDRIFWQDGRLHVQWWSHCDADPLAQARSFSHGSGRVLPAVLKRNDSDYASVREYLEEVYGPPEVFKLPWEEPVRDTRGDKCFHIVATDRQTKKREPVTEAMQYSTAIAWKAGSILKRTHKYFKVARVNIEANNH